MRYMLDGGMHSLYVVVTCRMTDETRNDIISLCSALLRAQVDRLPSIDLHSSHSSLKMLYLRMTFMAIIDLD